MLGRLGSGERGLTGEEARRRLDEFGPNVLRSHGARPWSVLVRQLRSFLLVLLVSAAVVSAAVGETTAAGIILTIVALSVGLGFVNEYRSEKAVEALHSQIRRSALVERDRQAQQVDVVALVPGDVVRLGVGDIVPVDLRLLEANGLECDESVMTGESAAAAKTAAPGRGDSPLDLPSCAFMGTVVPQRRGPRSGGADRASHRIRRHRAEARRPPPADGLPAWLAGLLAHARGGDEGAGGLDLRAQRRPGPVVARVAAVFARDRRRNDASAAAGDRHGQPSTGARRLARRVVVKRLVASRISATSRCCSRTRPARSPKDGSRLSRHSTRPASPGRKCSARVGRNEGTSRMERGGWQRARPRALGGASRRRRSTEGWRRIAEAPFDHERQLGSVLVEAEPSRVVVKGAPEAILAALRHVPAGGESARRQFPSGSRVVAVATRPAVDMAA